MAFTTVKMTFEEFLTYDDGTETLYELENGKIIAMPAESDLNQRIAAFLFSVLLKLGIESYRLRIGMEIAVMST